MTTGQLTSFHLAGHLLGVAVDNIQEVLRPQETTRVPRADPAIGGLINIRGQVVTAVDLRARLGLAPRQPGEVPMNLVVRTDDGPVSLLVDRIGEVVEVTEGQFEPPPETLGGEARRLLVGAYKLPDCLILALDVRRAIELAVPEPAA